jgi:hypothetical protein
LLICPDGVECREENINQTKIKIREEWEKTWENIIDDIETSVFKS